MIAFADCFHCYIKLAVILILNEAAQIVVGDMLAVGHQVTMITTSGLEPFGMALDAKLAHYWRLELTQPWVDLAVSPVDTEPAVSVLCSAADRSDVGFG